MPSIKAKGINLKSCKVGEADKILTIFTEEVGKVSAIAKGARRPTSKFGGRLEMFNLNNYFLAEGRSLYIVSQVETIENFYALKNDEESLRAAAFLTKLVDSTTEHGHKNPALFHLLAEWLCLLKEGITPEIVKTAFEFRLMEAEGFFPYLEGCVKCKKMVKVEPERATFSLRLGGLLCSACSKKFSGGTTLPYALIKLMKKIGKGKSEEIRELKIEKTDTEQLREISRSYISDHIGKDIRSW